MLRSPELERLVLRFYRVLESGDTEGLAELLSDDESLTLFGSDAEEFWRTKREVLGVISKQIEESPYDSFVREFRPSEHLRMWEEGSIGWGYDLPIAVTFDGTELRSRFTFVFRLEGVRWCLVHAHASVGVANEDTWGRRFTTTMDSIAMAVEAERTDLTAFAATDGTVTMVFTDIEASTEIAERVGDHRWLELLRWHDGVLRDAASANSGAVVKSQGDGYMLAFGSASKALDFSVALHAGCARGFEGEQIRVRIGVNTGDAIRTADDYFGHAVTVAARVASQAHGCETLVTDVVTGLVSGANRFTFGEPRLAELKGVPGHFALRPLLAAV